MKSRRRWNQGLAIVVIAASITLSAKPASAELMQCPQEFCVTSCNFTCETPGCQDKLCDAQTCYTTGGGTTPYAGVCDSSS
jgi:hypothetical protein